MIGLGDKSVCGNCHSADDGTKAAAEINEIQTGIGKLKSAADSAQTLLSNVRQKGMMISDIEFLMKDVNQAIIQSRINIHAFNADSVLPKADTGIKKADEAQLKAASLIDNYYFRRKGLVISTIIMTFLVVMLYLKIRRIEKR